MSTPSIKAQDTIYFLTSHLLEAHCCAFCFYNTGQNKSDTLKGWIISVCPSIKVSLHKCWLCQSRQVKPYLPLTNSGIDKLPGFLIFYSVFVNGYWFRHSGKNYPQYAWHWLNTVHFEMEAAKQRFTVTQRGFQHFLTLCINGSILKHFKFRFFPE